MVFLYKKKGLRRAEAVWTRMEEVILCGRILWMDLKLNLHG